MPKLNFTRNITEFYSNYFKVQLYFENPLEVSFESGLRDQFKLTVTNSSLLIGQETNSKLREGTSITTFLPPQIREEDKGISQILLDILEKAANAFQLFTVGTWSSSLIVGSMSLMWGLINSLQIIAHIPDLNVVMPANSMIVYDTIYKIANFQNPLIEPC